jgi:hypothetical protein
VPAGLPSPLPAGPSPLRLGGSFWSRYEMREGYQEHCLTNPRLAREGDYVVSRARLALSTTPVDVVGGVNVSATFVPQAAYTWGESTGTNPTVSDHPLLSLYEGYASAGTRWYRFDAGRFAMNYGDALVIGDLDWNESARAFNGARVHLTPGEKPYFIDAFGTIILDGRATTQQAVSGDTYFYGIYAGCGPLVGKNVDLDVYLLALTTERNRKVPLTNPMDMTQTALGRQKSGTVAPFGSRFKGKASVFDWRAEAGVQFGSKAPAPTWVAQRPDTKTKLAYQLDGEIGLSPVKAFRLGLEGLAASGDDLATADKDEGYDEMYPTSHKWLGLMDVMGGRTNVSSAVLHLAVLPVEPLAIALDGHYFARPELGTDGKHGGAGGEIDTNVVYTIGKGATLRGLYGVFLPNEDFWSKKAPDRTNAGTPLHYVEVQFGYVFK